MNNIKKTKAIIASTVVSLLLAGTAFAGSEVTTIESRVISNSGNAGSFSVSGPDSVQYRIEASPGEVQRIQTFVKTNPDALVRFDGAVVESNGTKVFRVNKWEQSTKTSKTTSTDSMGNTKVTETTETSTKP